MVPRNFLRQLAIERCKQHLAQLSAIHYIGQEGLDCGCDSEAARTVQALIESLDRDLSLVQDELEDVTLLDHVAEA